MPLPGSRKRKDPERRGDGKLRSNVNYFVSGEDVVFKLGELDFTFENFYLYICEEGFFLKVGEETPMNLLKILDTVHDEVGVDRKLVIDSDVVDMMIQLDPDIYLALKKKIMNCRDPREVFDLDIEGFRFVKELEHYYLIEYGTRSARLDLHLGGRIGNAIRRKLMF